MSNLTVTPVDKCDFPPLPSHNLAGNSQSLVVSDLLLPLVVQSFSSSLEQSDNLGLRLQGEASAWRPTGFVYVLLKNIALILLGQVEM